VGLDSSKTSDANFDIDALCEGSPDWDRAIQHVRRAAAVGELKGQVVGLARLIPGLMIDRRKAVSFSAAVAISDPEFLDLINAGDRERDARSWDTAEYAYYRALIIYPYFAGYRVQYAHCLKEKGKFLAASLEYYSSLALGAPRSDVESHLAFSLSRVGLSPNAGWVNYCETFWSVADGDASIISSPPSGGDVEILTELLLNRINFSEMDRLELINSANTIGAVTVELIKRPDFVAANRDLLRVVAANSVSRAA
jgi:hypothetical protein